MNIIPLHSKLYGSKGELIQEVKPQGVVPKLKKGNNELIFSGNGSTNYNNRLQITVISEGAPLDVRYFSVFSFSITQLLITHN